MSDYNNKNDSLKELDDKLNGAATKLNMDVDDSQFASLPKRRTWPQLKSVVEFSRKLMFNLNGDSPANIFFRKYFNHERNQFEHRVYFLAGTQKREITIKFVDIRPMMSESKLVGASIFQNSLLQTDLSLTSQPSTTTTTKQQLTKEEQLLRERKRCSFNGITSFNLDVNSGRLVFTERSDLFYFDDEIPIVVSEIIFVVVGFLSILIL